MKDAEVYNNGHGWRIEFSFQGAIRVLTLPEAIDLIAMLRYALIRIDDKNSRNEKA